MLTPILIGLSLLAVATAAFLFNRLRSLEITPGLENKLHRLFNDRRINRVNERKEFFRVTIEEIAEAVRSNHGEIEFTMAAEAADYRKTLALLQDGDTVQVQTSVLNA
jgi:hypothetical protein